MLPHTERQRRDTGKTAEPSLGQEPIDHPRVTNAVNRILALNRPLEDLMVRMLGDKPKRKTSVVVDSSITRCLKTGDEP